MATVAAGVAGLSLDEVERTAVKACMGAGLSYGLAEDAAAACRWLHAVGLDGASALMVALGEPLHVRLFASKDVADDGASATAYLFAPGPTLVRVPSALDLVSAGHAHSVRLQALAAPTMAFALAAVRARTDGGPSVALQVRDERWRIYAPAEDMPARDPARTDARLKADAYVSYPSAHASRAFPDPGAWHTLGRLAALTYVPATEHSRRRGAGPS